jgi:hypothetical protein
LRTRARPATLRLALPPGPPRPSLAMHPPASYVPALQAGMIATASRRAGAAAARRPARRRLRGPGAGVLASRRRGGAHFRRSRRWEPRPRWRRWALGANKGEAREQRNARAGREPGEDEVHRARPGGPCSDREPGRTGWRGVWAAVLASGRPSVGCRQWGRAAAGPPPAAAAWGSVRGAAGGGARARAALLMGEYNKHGPGAAKSGLKGPFRGAGPQWDASRREPTECGAQLQEASVAAGRELAAGGTHAYVWKGAH